MVYEGFRGIMRETAIIIIIIVIRSFKIFKIIFRSLRSRSVMWRGKKVIRVIRVIRVISGLKSGEMLVPARYICTDMI